MAPNRMNAWRIVDTEADTPMIWMLWPPTWTAPNRSATKATPDGRSRASAATMMPA